MRLPRRPVWLRSVPRSPQQRHLRIGFLCSEYPPYPHGGIGTMVRALATRLVERGHDAFVFGSYSGVREPVWEEHDGVHLLRLPRPNPRFREATRRVQLARHARRLVSERRLDLLEVPDYQGDSALFPPLGCPVLLRFNNPDIVLDQSLRPRSQRAAEYMAVHRADFLLSTSYYLERHARRFYRLPKALQIPTLHNAVDQRRFAPISPERAQPYRIVHWGKTDLKKNTRRMFVAMEHLLADFPQAELIFIGQDSPDARTGRSSAELALQGLLPRTRERIRLTGPVPNLELKEWIAESAVGLFPSIVEGFPLVVAEALAFGLPLVVARQGPAAEVVTHEVAGLHCDGLDPRDMAHALAELLADPAKRVRLARGARELSEAILDIDRWVDANLAHYRRICGT